MLSIYDRYRELFNQSFNNRPENVAKYQKLKNHVGDKKYFELVDLDCLGLEISVLMLLGKKGIGKTYQLLNLFHAIDQNPNQKILFMRVSNEETKNLKNEWNVNQDIPFFIKGNMIYSKTKTKIKKTTNSKGIEVDVHEPAHKGMIGSLSTINNLRSLQYQDYDYLVVDEFVLETDNYPNKQGVVTSFLKLVENVQRDKPNINVYLFGNNNGTDNPFLNYFAISDQTNLVWEPSIRFLFVNLKGLYQGSLETSIVNKVAEIFDPVLAKYLKYNESGVWNDFTFPIENTQFFTRTESFCVNNIFYVFGFYYTKTNDLVYGVWQEPYRPDQKYFTNDIVMKHKYQNVVYYPPLVIDRYVKMFNDLIKINKLLMPNTAFNRDVFYQFIKQK